MQQRNNNFNDNSYDSKIKVIIAIAKTEMLNRDIDIYGTMNVLIVVAIVMIELTSIVIQELIVM